MASTTRDAILAARRVSVIKGLGRPASEAEIAEYLDPWTDSRVTRSWLALAGAADHRYTMEMLPALLQSKTPKLLVWGEDDGFQTVDYAERYEREIRKTRLVRIKSRGGLRFPVPARRYRQPATGRPVSLNGLILGPCS